MSTQIPRHVSAGNLIYRSESVPIFNRSAGLYLYDNQGRRYLDFEAANGTVPFGYDASLLSEALQRAASMPGLPSFCESELRLSVLDKLERLFSDGVDRGRVDLDLGGAQGMETALRIVAANKGPGTILVFEGAFHGRSGITSMLSSSPRYRELLTAWGLDVVRIPPPGVIRRETTRRGFMAADEMFGELTGVGGAQHARGVVAFIFEPILNVGGMVEPDALLLRQYVAAARGEGALIIADEVFTGMHRVGPRWGHQRSGVDPDIVVTGKGLTNGIAPASVIWSRGDLASAENYPPGSHSSTFVGIPTTLAAIDAVIDRWAAWSQVEVDVAALEAALIGLVSDLRDEFPKLVEGGRVYGGSAGLQLFGPIAHKIRNFAMGGHADRALVVASTGIMADVINIHPPLIATSDSVDEAKLALRDAFAKYALEAN